MIKPLIILVNTFFIYLFSIIFGDGSVKLEGNIPSSAKSGTEFIAEIKVTKGSIGGFAKLQIDVPQGVTVKELESKGGNFSFAGTTGKIIWTAVPSDADFTVKFVLNADGTVSGTKNITSKFSYVVNNAKESAEMAPASVDFGGGSSSVATTTTPDNNTTSDPVKTTEPEVKTTTTTDNKTGVTTTVDTYTYNPGESASSVVCSRTITKGAKDGEYNVLVKIRKPGIKGFAKYQEIIPEGYTIRGGNTSGSSFSVADGKAKFVWVSLPPEDEINISYIAELGPTANPASGLNGEFSYIENDQTKKKKLPIDFINNNGSVVTTKNFSGNEVKSDNGNGSSNNGGGSSNTNGGGNGSDNSDGGSSSNGTGVAYRVQIGAFQNAISSSVLKRKFNVSENIKSEMAEGFSKFMIGNYGTYSVARNNREKMKDKGCRSAFVVAYNGPKRITVQEALMITNQKWVQ